MNKEGKVVAIDRLLAGCVPKDVSTAALEVGGVKVPGFVHGENEKSVF